MSELDDLRKRNATLEMELLLWKKGDPKFRMGQVLWMENANNGPHSYPWAMIVRRMRWNDAERHFEYTNQSREMESRTNRFRHETGPMTRWIPESELRVLTNEEFRGAETSSTEDSDGPAARRVLYVGGEFDS